MQPPCLLEGAHPFIVESAVMSALGWWCGESAEWMGSPRSGCCRLWQTKASGDNSTLLLAVFTFKQEAQGGEGKKKSRTEEQKERKMEEEGGSECSGTGVCTVCLRIAAEKIPFFCQWDVPEGDSEDYSLLTPGNTLHAEALQPRQPDRTAGKMSWVRHLRGSTVVSWFLNVN